MNSAGASRHDSIARNCHAIAVTQSSGWLIVRFATRFALRQSLLHVSQMLTHQIKRSPHRVERIGEGLDVPASLRGVIQTGDLLANHRLGAGDVIACKLKLLLGEVPLLHPRAFPASPEMKCSEF